MLSVDEARSQPQGIHRLQRQCRKLAGVLAGRDREAVVELHQNAQRLLRPLAVANLLATELTFLDIQIRTRRDTVLTHHSPASRHPWVEIAREEGEQILTSTILQFAHLARPHRRGHRDRRSDLSRRLHGSRRRAGEAGRKGDAAVTNRRGGGAVPGGA